MRNLFDSTTRDLCLFAFPVLVGNILQSCYNMVDMAVVGQFAGREALAAVSNTAMICFISNAICIGFSTGGTVLVARYRGADSRRDQFDTVKAVLILAALGGMLLTGANYLLYPLILRLMDVPAAALSHAYDYMNIVSAGNVFVFGYNAVCAIMRGFGDSRRPLYFIAVAAAVNIALDYLLVGAFGWGVSGAALATVLAQAASCVMALYFLFFRTNLRRGLADLPVADGILSILFGKGKELLRLGLPTALAASILNLSYIIVTALFNGSGIAAAAAAGIGLKINTFVAMPCWAAGQTVTTFAGHSMGAGQPELAAKAARKGLKAGLVFTAAFLLALHLVLRPFLYFFSPDPEVVNHAILYLRICCSVNFLPYTIMYILDSFAVGVGSPVFAMLNSLLQSLVLRLGLSIVLINIMDNRFVALCIAESVSPLVPALIALLYFWHRGWRKR